MEFMNCMEEGKLKFDSFDEETQENLKCFVENITNSLK